jgi:hypothetical protein
MKTAVIKIPCTYYRVNHDAWMTSKHRCMIEGKTCQQEFHSLHTCPIIQHKWNQLDKLLYMSNQLEVKLWSLYTSPEPH